MGMRLFLFAAWLVVFAVAIPAQQTPTFEVASIRATDPGTVGNTVGLRVTGSQVRYGGLSLKDYIGLAYDMSPQQVFAPDWAASQRFEIAATLPPGATREQVPEMLRALLAERFQLRVRKETRELPVYALTVSRGGLNIKGTPVDPNEPPPAATETTGAAANNAITIGIGAGSLTFGSNKFEIRRLTMADLAAGLTRFLERKTIDLTGSTDRFDFTMELEPRDASFVSIRAAVTNGFPVATDALRFLEGAPSNVLGPYIAETGLVLEERRALLEVVIMESASKEPTLN